MLREHGFITFHLVMKSLDTLGKGEHSFFFGRIRVLSYRPEPLIPAFCITQHDVGQMPGNTVVFFHETSIFVGQIRLYLLIAEKTPQQKIQAFGRIVIQFTKFFLRHRLGNGLHVEH